MQKNVLVDDKKREGLDRWIEVNLAHSDCKHDLNQLENDIYMSILCLDLVCWFNLIIYVVWLEFLAYH